MPGGSACSSAASVASSSANRCHAQRAERLRHALAPACAQQWDDVSPAAEHPGDRELRDAEAVPLGEHPHRVDQREVVRQIRADVARTVSAHV